MVAYTVNVTAKRKKELEIIWLAEHNRKIIKALPEFIFIFDDNFFLIDVMMAPDTVLLNLRIAKMSGIQITEKIRLISTFIPVVAVTEHSYYTEQQQAYQAGCNEIITKPYSLDRLKETVKVLLQDA